MLLRVAALALLVAFSAPIAASAITASPAPMAMKMKKKTSKKKASGVTNKVPGGPGFTGSSPLGSAEKKK